MTAQEPSNLQQSKLPGLSRPHPCCRKAVRSRFFRFLHFFETKFPLLLRPHPAYGNVENHYLEFLASYFFPTNGLSYRFLGLIRAGTAWDQAGKKSLIFLAFFGIAWYEQRLPGRRPGRLVRMRSPVRIWLSAPEREHPVWGALFLHLRLVFELATSNAKHFSINGQAQRACPPVRIWLSRRRSLRTARKGRLAAGLGTMLNFFAFSFFCCEQHDQSRKSARHRTTIQIRDQTMQRQWLQLFPQKHIKQGLKR